MIVPVQSDSRELPFYASKGSAGMDIRCREELILLPGQTVLAATGLRLAIPEGCELQIRPRSGLSVKTRLVVANSPGTIDSDYRDEIKIILRNAFTQAELAERFLLQADLLATLGEEISYRVYLERQGQSLDAWPERLLEQKLYLNREGQPWGTLHFAAGERIAQMILARYEKMDFQLCEDVRQWGEDRGGGFGSTGRL